MNEHAHLVRVEMYKAAAELLGPGSRNGYYPPSTSLEVLEVSGEAFRSLLPWCSYDARGDIDVCSLEDVRTKLGHRRYDLVILDNVLEHVIAPRDAIETLRLSALNPRGRLFVSTPFLIRVHPAPLDLWRWTRDGLGELLESGGYNDVHTGSWGNKAAVVANFDGWATWTPEADMTNDPHYPVTCWAVGTR